MKTAIALMSDWGHVTLELDLSMPHVVRDVLTNAALLPEKLPTWVRPPKAGVVVCSHTQHLADEVRVCCALLQAIVVPCWQVDLQAGRTIDLVTYCTAAHHLWHGLAKP